MLIDLPETARALARMAVVHQCREAGTFGIGFVSLIFVCSVSQPICCSPDKHPMQASNPDAGVKLAASPAYQLTARTVFIEHREDHTGSMRSPTQLYTCVDRLIKAHLVLENSN